MNFLNPIWLWGLLGLTIPIGIHLLSRKEGKTIYIGSLRHLIDSNTTRFSSLRLNEIFLLLLRMMIIALIVFLLADLILPINNQPDKKWLLVEKGVERDQRFKIVVDSLEVAGFEARFLSNNFPFISDSTSVQPITNYNALLSDPDLHQLREVVILAYTYSKQFKGERLVLPENCTWIAVEPVNEDFLLSVMKLHGDSLKVTVGETSGESTAFYTKIVRNTQRIGDTYRSNTDTTKILKTAALTVNVYASSAFEKDSRVLVASLEAISAETLIPFHITKFPSTQSTVSSGDLNFWLSDEPVPSGFTSGIVFQQCVQHDLPMLVDSSRAMLYCTIDPGSDWVLTKRLTQENVLQENFTLALAKIISQKIYPNGKPFQDHRSLPTALAWSKSKNKISGNDVSSDSMEMYLALALLLLLVAERGVAFKRNQ